MNAQHKPILAHAERIFQKIDVAPLLAQIEASPDLWNTRPERRDAPASPHSQMSDIWVRYNRIDRLIESPGHFNEEHVPVWYPAWKKLTALRPIIFKLMNEVQGEMLGGVLITKIPPGCGIDPHFDKSWHVDYYDKFYLSLKSGPGAVFTLDTPEGRVKIEPQAGEMWRIDNRLRHWVTNDSDDDRITAIICIRTDLFGRF